jgi:hypothetical protein
MLPAHSRRRVSRRPCRRRNAAATDDLSDLTELVATAAARLARQLNDPAYGQDDIEQELRLRLLEGMPRHDPALGDRVKFAKILISRQKETLLRAHFAEKRRAPTVSLEQPISSGGDEAKLSSIVSGDRRHAELGRTSRTPVDYTDLRLDLQTVTGKLSPDDQTRAEQLMNSKSMAEAARQAGIARTTFNDQLRAQRKLFEQAGMKEYLK